MADIIYSDGENASTKGTTFCVVGGVSAAFGVGTMTAIGLGLVASGPVGWAIVGGLTNQEAEKLKTIAQAINLEGFDDEKEIFDINGDGYLNTADSMALNFATKGKSDVLNNIVNNWQNSNGDIQKAIVDAYVATLDEGEAKSISSNYNNATLSEKRALANGYLSILTEGLYEDINSFNITRDWYTDDKDMEYFSSIDADMDICDINGDGSIDENDVNILNTYLKANMERLVAIEKEADAIRGVTFKEGEFSDEYKNELAGIKS